MFHLCKNLMSKLLCPVKLVNLHIISLQGFLWVQAEPEPTDPTHCQQQVFAEKISQEVGQVTAAARQSVYGQAAADAAKNCPTSP